MIRILLLDNRKNRRKLLLNQLASRPDILVSAPDKVTGQEISQINCDLVLVHEGNDEFCGIEDESWNVGKARVIIFSGGYAKDCDEWNGMLYVSERYLMTNIINLVVGQTCK